MKLSDSISFLSRFFICFFCIYMYVYAVPMHCYCNAAQLIFLFEKTRKKISYQNLCVQEKSTERNRRNKLST